MNQIKTIYESANVEIINIVPTDVILTSGEDDGVIDSGSSWDS